MERIRARAALGFLLAAQAACLAVPLAAQSKSNTFEVADVHVSAPGAKQMDGGFIPGGRLELRGATMVDLISAAYGMDDSDHVQGGPGWLSTDRFDVIAKAPAANTPDEKLQAMLKALLEDRFKLVTHQGKKDMPVFILTAKKGAKLTKAEKPDQPKAQSASGDPALNMHIRFSSYKMEMLADYLPEQARNFINRPVVDETHLSGAYDFQLDWMGINIYRRAKANPDGPAPVGIFEALDKIGLHLEAGTRSLPVIIVDSVNQTPTPNAVDVTAKIPTFPTEFEVAEVRPAKPLFPEPPQPPGPRGQIRMQNGQLEIMSATLSGLVTMAFQLDVHMLVGAPKWMSEDRFDVIAKTIPDLPDDSLMEMLRKVLTERFHLVTHSEEQSLPVYVLLAGRNPKLTPSDGTAHSDCKIENADRRYYVCKNTTLAQFAERLPGVSAAYIHPPVLDLTELKGAYDFRLYWTPKGLLATPSTQTPVEVATTPFDQTTVFDAVEKQLGLKLEEQKHPTQVLVIAAVERIPTAQ